jgi:hypothetical protein
MAQIQAVSIWKDGVEKQAEVLTLRIVMDDMASSCTFYYEMKEADVVNEDESVTPGQVLAVGNSSMGSQDYIDWDGSNAEAYTYVAGKLNLVLV